MYVLIGILCSKYIGNDLPERCERFLCDKILRPESEVNSGNYSYRDNIWHLSVFRR